jgi:hypothetical protein
MGKTSREAVAAGDCGGPESAPHPHNMTIANNKVSLRPIDDGLNMQEFNVIGVP